MRKSTIEDYKAQDMYGLLKGDIAIGFGGRGDDGLLYEIRIRACITPKRTATTIFFYGGFRIVQSKTTCYNYRQRPCLLHGLCLGNDSVRANLLGKVREASLLVAD